MMKPTTNQVKHLLTPIQLDTLHDIPQHWTDRAKGGRFRLRLGKEGKVMMPKVKKTATGYVQSTFATDQYTITKGIQEFSLKWKP